MSKDLGSKIPLIETFGPVYQGEGALIGRPTWFVRLGACDYLCTQCDSMHAVDPKQIALNATVMSAQEIGERCIKEMGTTPLVTVSGGNPALWDMKEFIRVTMQHRKEVAIETQGTVFKPWIQYCDYITISPKGPGMLSVREARAGLPVFKRFLHQSLRGRWENRGVTVKVPVFDTADLLFAEEVLDIVKEKSNSIPLYLSVGNSWVGSSRPEDMPILRNVLLDRMEKIFQLVIASHPKLQECAILPQLHVLHYGNELRR